MTKKAKRQRAKHTRDAAATRSAILRAAGKAFTDKGYGRVGVREIAREAGVTAALINRYFVSKQALFLEVIKSCRGDGPRIIPGRSDLMGQAFATAVVEPSKNEALDPMLIFLRSVTHGDESGILRDMLQVLSRPKVKELKNPDARLRLELIIATLIGFDLLRTVVKTPELAKAKPRWLIKLLGNALQTFVDA
jgi:AcrR family transcriptional regulator